MPDIDRAKAEAALATARVTVAALEAALGIFELDPIIPTKSAAVMMRMEYDTARKAVMKFGEIDALTKKRGFRLSYIRAFVAGRAAG